MFGILGDFGIQDKMFGIVTDGAANMKATCGVKGKLLEKLKAEQTVHKKGGLGT